MNRDVLRRAVWRTACLHAQRGDVDAAREVLVALRDSLRGGQPLPAAVQHYLADALDQYLSGQQDIERALNLRGAAHRPTGTGRDPVPPVALFWLLRTRDWLSADAAAGRVCEAFGLDARTLDRYRKAAKGLDTLPVADLLALSQPSTPHAPIQYRRAGKK